MEILEVLEWALGSLEKERSKGVPDEIHTLEPKGLCEHLSDGFMNIHRILVPFYRLDHAIPEFTRRFFWWPRHDFDSRIRALEKLIEIYKQKVNHENSKN